MPLYLFEVGVTNEEAWERAAAVAAARFPEVVLERRYAAHRAEDRDTWVCRAPGQGHLERWSAAAGVQLGDLRHVAAMDARP